MNACQNLHNKGELVSVIVPVYNVRKYLDRCLKSICKQSYRNLEIILVDDGSFDGSGELCDSWANKDSRIKVLHKINAGLAEARNSGIRIANGEWVCFVDSDDFIHEKYVEVMYGATLINDTYLVQCKFERGTKEYFSDDKADTDIIIKSHSLDDFYRYCYTVQGHSVFACWINLYHKSVFDSIYFPNIKHTEDVPFVQEAIKYCAQKELITVSCTMYYWFQREGSIMNQKANLSLLDQCLAYEMVLDFWKKHNKRLISEMFFSVYFECLVEEYISLRRDIPDMQGKYEFLLDKIKKNFSRALQTSNSCLILPSVEFDLFAYLNGKRIIMYGYGEKGKWILPWLKYFNIIPKEIWDVKASEREYIDDIPFCKMHSFVDEKNTVILITVQSSNVRLMIEKNLNDLKYYDTIDWLTIRYSIRRLCYKKFLPFLLEGI